MPGEEDRKAKVSRRAGNDLTAIRALGPRMAAGQPALAARSRAKRFSVRPLFAAAMDPFFARADRSSAVMFFAAVFPPRLQYVFPIWRTYASTAGGMRLGMV